MFVISGVTGRTGAVAASGLLEAGHDVRVIVRTAEAAGQWKDRGAEAVIADRGSAQDRVERIIEARDQASRRLADLSGVRKVYPSEGNFLLMEMDRARDFHAFAAGRGLLLRDFSSKPGLADCLRVSIGTETEMEQLFALLEEWTS